MIQRLSIQGLALIDRLAIEFSPGFNVITGETGAGKSILIRALDFLTGGKATSETVRKGCEQAVVCGEFWVPEKHPVLEMLEALGVPLELQDKHYPVLIRRQLSAKGRSQAWVNDIGMTSGPLKEVGKLLVDVFAQHENQRLMDPALHVGYLDDFISVADAKEQVRRAYDACFDSIEKMQLWLERFRSGEQGRDFLQFRLEELRTFDPTEADYDQVYSCCQGTKHRSRLKEVFHKAVHAVDENGGVGSKLWEAHHALDVSKDLDAEFAQKILELKNRLAQVATEVDDLTFELGQFLGRFDVDESELEAAEERLYGYQRLFRKHNTAEIKGLLETKANLESELEYTEKAEEHLEDELGELQKSVDALALSCKKLSAARKQAASFITKAVEKELMELSMKGSRFSVEFGQLNRPLPALDFDGVEAKLAKKWDTVSEPLTHMGREGAESVQFLLSANPGEPMLPLARVASGGEISRIMLALKKSLSIDADTCVLVFDEIDTGISGRVANVVGKKMRELSNSFQVICITHLPQVAAHAQAHFRVSKSGSQKRTQTAIEKLTPSESLEEIARLLSGEEVSKTSLANARSLVEKAAPLST
ncbi:MAG: DNA repair protein RecN [Bdellovibrionaceae bacterium]|nr:DNA repair protein RecN [Pseudobdellovibrionaceae bacterium]